MHPLRTRYCDSPAARGGILVKSECFDLVDEQGRVVGRALRSECHGNPALLHQAVHVFVFHPDGSLFLQKRSMSKDTQPGKWDSSVGGHVDAGETPEAAALRELGEELGLRGAAPAFLYSYLWKCPVETELIRSYRLVHPGPFVLQASEIDEGRFWSAVEIDAAIGQEVFTPNFEMEWPRIRHFAA